MSFPKNATNERNARDTPRRPITPMPPGAEVLGNIKALL